MKRIWAILLILCLLLSACGGSDSDELIVEVQREASSVTVPPITEVPTFPVTTPVTEPTTIPTTVPDTEPTEVPTEEPTEVATEEPTETTVPETEAPLSEGQDYVLNKSSKKFHYPHCGSVKQMKEKNRKDFYGPREEILSMGYVPCKNCKP